MASRAVSLMICVAAAVSAPEATAGGRGAARVRAGTPDDLAVRLADLSSPTADVRAGAERWLAAHVRVEDAPALGGAIRRGDLEVVLRIERALVEARSGMRLAAAFFASEEPVLRALGGRVLEARLVRVLEHGREPGLVGAELDRAIRLTARRSWPEVFRLPLRATLGEVCGLLARRGRLPVGIVVAPEVAGLVAPDASEALPDSAREVAGSWDEVVWNLARFYRVGIEGHDFDPVEDGARAGAFLRFTEPADAGQRSAADVLRGLCDDVLRSPSAARRRGAARALAGMRNADALEWLASRAFEADDEAALEAVLVAAAEERVVPALGRPGRIRTLVARAAAALPAGDPLAFRVVDALSRLDDVQLEEPSTGTVVLEGWEASAEPGRWLRLAILEGIRSPAALAPARAVLADPGAGPALAAQALRAFAAACAGTVPEPALELAAPGVLLAFARDVEDALGLALDLELLRVAPEGVARDPTALDGGEYGRATALLWFARSGDIEVAGAYARVLADTLEVGELARILAELGEVGTRVWRSARTSAPSESLERAALVAEVVPPELFEEVASPFVSRPVDDFEVLAAIAAGSGPSSARARDRLTRRFEEAFAPGKEVSPGLPVAVAIVRAIDGIREHELALGAGIAPDERRTSDVWVRELRLLLRRNAGAPLALVLGPEWPGPLPPRVIELARLDRRW